MKRLIKQFRYGEKGFTLIELLVVVAILGALAAVVVPNVGKFIGKGKEEAAATELHNIQTGVMAMLADSDAGKLDTDYSTPTDAMTTIKADSGTKQLSEYLTGLDASGKVTSGYVYAFTQDGAVTQSTPPPAP